MNHAKPSRSSSHPLQLQEVSLVQIFGTKTQGLPCTHPNILFLCLWAHEYRKAGMVELFQTHHQKKKKKHRRMCTHTQTQHNNNNNINATKNWVYRKWNAQPHVLNYQDTIKVKSVSGRISSITWTVASRFKNPCWICWVGYRSNTWILMNFYGFHFQRLVDGRILPTMNLTPHVHVKNKYPLFLVTS